MREGSDRLSALSLMAAIWLFLSPWVVRPWHHLYAIDAWMVGAVTVVILTSAMRPPRPVLSDIVAALLGAWMFVSPWALNYTNDIGPAWNSWIIGGTIFVLALGASALGVRGARRVQQA
ncbi:MAG: SPW repeat protein [Deinococcales bacterium]